MLAALRLRFLENTPSQAGIEHPGSVWGVIDASFLEGRGTILVLQDGSGSWHTVEGIRMLDDVMGSAFGTATNPRTFNPTIDVRTSEDEVVFVCDEEKLSAELVDGVLTVRIPRQPKAKPRKIAINAGSTNGGSKQLNE